jgi:hypothetical protein
MYRVNLATDRIQNHKPFTVVTLALIALVDINPVIIRM